MNDTLTAILVGAGIGVAVPLVWYLPWLVWGLWDDLTAPRPKAYREYGEHLATGFAKGAGIASPATVQRRQTDD